MDFGHLDLRHLRLVRAVVEEGSLTGAARRLALSQPALSHQLKGVESLLGINLFERQGRSLVLTEAGRRVLGAAHVVLAEVDRAESDLAALATGRTGTLRVASECYTTYNWLPSVVAAFGHSYPDVVVELAAEATEMPGHALAAREIDVALATAEDDSGEGLTLVPLFSDEVVAIVASGHGWAGQPFVTASDFASEHVYVHQSIVSRDCVLSGVLGPAGVTPARVTSVPLSTEAVVGMVRAGLGVTMMAQWAACPYLERGGLAAVRITAAGVHRTWYAAVRDEHRPAYVDAFVEALGDVMFAVGETADSPPQC